MDSTKDFVDVITTAWNQLDAEQIVKHLDESFRYDSQWVFDYLDYNGYIDYKGLESIKLNKFYNLCLNNNNK